MVAQLKVEVGLERRIVSVPQTHAPAAEAEVDFGEFTSGDRRDGDEVVDVLRAALALGQSSPRRDRFIIAAADTVMSRSNAELVAEVKHSGSTGRPQPSFPGSTALRQEPINSRQDARVRVLTKPTTRCFT